MTSTGSWPASRPGPGRRAAGSSSRFGLERHPAALLVVALVAACAITVLLGVTAV